MLGIPLGKGRFYDLLHRSLVTVCIFVSAVGMINLGVTFTRLLTKKPASQQSIEAQEIDAVVKALSSNEGIESA